LRLKPKVKVEEDDTFWTACSLVLLILGISVCAWSSTLVIVYLLSLLVRPLLCWCQAIVFVSRWTIESMLRVTSFIEAVFAFWNRLESINLQ
jgi:hypothetical protein